MIGLCGIRAWHSDASITCLQQIIWEYGGKYDGRKGSKSIRGVIGVNCFTPARGDQFGELVFLHFLAQVGKSGGQCSDLTQKEISLIWLGRGNFLPLLGFARAGKCYGSLSILDHNLEGTSPKKTLGYIA